MFQNLQRLYSRLAAHPVVGAAVARVSKVEGVTVIAAVAAAVSLAAFVKLAEMVLEQETNAFDEWLLLALRDPGDAADPIGPGWFEEMMRDFTALGSTGVVSLVALCVVGFLWITRKHHAAILVVVAVAGGTLISTLLKIGFARPRPQLVPHGMDVYTASFPSGHSMMSAVVYLTLGVLLARTQADRRVKVYVLASAGVLTILVGLSRVYLGVHWPTDVLAGWAIGSSWALLSWMAMLWLQSRGQVEPESSTSTVSAK